jgi:urease accessory protein
MSDDVHPTPGLSLHAQLSLLRLTSPALPVGAFSYSRGLEAAVAAGFVSDEVSAGDWIAGVLERCVCPLDGTVLLRLHRAFCADDHAEVLRWTRILRAFRESAELLFEDEQMGLGLARLLSARGVMGADLRSTGLPPSYTCMFALAAVRWGIDETHALTGFLYACCDSQVSAALRLLPLGQTAGQRMLERALAVIERCTHTAAAIPDDEIGNFAAGLALVSAHHETQYSRLFRS